MIPNGQFYKRAYCQHGRPSQPTITKHDVTELQKMQFAKKMQFAVIFFIGGVGSSSG
jgi:hypothetical protein